MFEKLKEKINCLVKKKETDKQKYEKILKKLEQKREKLLNQKDDGSKKQLKSTEKLIKRTKNIISGL